MLCGGVGLQMLYTVQDCKNLLKLFTKVQEWLRGKYAARVEEIGGKGQVERLLVAIRNSVIHVSQKMLTLPHHPLTGAD